MHLQVTRCVKAYFTAVAMSPVFCLGTNRSALHTQPGHSHMPQSGVGRSIQEAKSQQSSPLTDAQPSIASPHTGDASLQSWSPARPVCLETIYNRLTLAHAMLTPPAHTIPRVSHSPGTHTSGRPETQQNKLSSLGSETAALSSFFFFPLPKKLTGTFLVKPTLLTTCL